MAFSGKQAEVDSTMKYASFWQRLVANLIDILVFAPVMVIQAWVEPVSKGGALVLAVLFPCLRTGYVIYGHGRFGQTIGKWIMRIRVTRLAGECIGWREAWLRSSVDVCASTIGTIGWVIALATIADSAYYGVAWSRRLANLVALEPFWSIWARKVLEIWFWSEVVTMLLNRRRRALHDFIAGTVVVCEGTAEGPKPAV